VNTPDPPSGDLDGTPAPHRVRTFASTRLHELVCDHTHKRVRFRYVRKEEAAMSSETTTISDKAWMLVWAGVLVFAALCVYAAALN
jgi:hypothetical protein